MQNEIIKTAIAAGAKIYASISGGKDGQAMAKHLDNLGHEITGFVYAELGRVEWPESLGMCHKMAELFNIPLHIIKRTDGADMLQHWQNRLDKVAGTGKPFWSSKQNRYCTSDLKRDPIDKFFRNCGDDFIISCEGIRAQESETRSKYEPISIRKRITSPFYDGMTVEEAIANYTPGKRLAITWYPIFDFTLEEVWATFEVDGIALGAAQAQYRQDNTVPAWWQFHPAYVYGNERVSCMFCIMGSINDLKVAAKHNPGLLNTMVAMEEQGNATFKTNWSLKQLL